MEPKMDGTNDYFGKVWVADATTSEPADWQMKWPDAGTGAANKPLHSGYAGITGCSSAGLAQLEVDYILIKSPTLSNITVNFDPQGPPIHAPELQTVARSGTNSISVNWFGGTLQSAGALTGPWANVANTPSPYTVKATGTNKFYRVLTVAPTNILQLAVHMSGPAEVPPTTSTATGSGSILINGNTLTYHIPYSGLSGPAVAAHIHGPAKSTEAANVMVPLKFDAAAQGVLSGTIDLTTLSAAQVDAITSGNAYVNIHTAANPTGEIRGQLLP
jgi:hypothetical protein